MTEPGVGFSLVEQAENTRTNILTAWTELTGYMQAAHEDGTTLVPADVLSYMHELRREARKPEAEFRRRYGGSS